MKVLFNLKPQCDYVRKKPQTYISLLENPSASMQQSHGKSFAGAEAAPKGLEVSEGGICGGKTQNWLALNDLEGVED